MRRFEQQTPQGTRFWELELLGTELTLRSGKVGSKAFPDERNETYRNATEAKREAERLISSRLANGFVEVEKVSVAAELEDALAQGDEQAWLVFADRLQADGDVRGDLIALQQQLGKKRSARKETAAFVDKHASELLGALADKTGQLELAWRFGYLEAAKVMCRRKSSTRDDDEQHGIDALLPALLSHESSRFLKTLRLGWPEPDSESSYEAAVDVLVAEAWPRHLETLVLGDFSDSAARSFVASYEDPEWLDEETGVDLWPDLRSLTALSPKCGSLRRLEVRANLRRLGVLTLPRVEHVTLSGQHLSQAVFDDLYSSRLPMLKGLVIEADRSPALNIGSLAPLIEGHFFPSLEHFGLGGLGVDVVDSLALSSRMHRLKVLDLSNNGLVDTDVERVLSHQQRLSKLDRVLLRHNCFSKQATKELKDALPNADVAYQRAVRRRRANRYEGVGE